MVNQAPSGQTSVLNTDEDQPLVFSATDFGFSDPDNDTFIGIRIKSLPGAGILKLAGVDVAVDDFIDAAEISDLTWTPVANANGAGFTHFTFSVVDSGGTDNGGVDTDPLPKTITINVNPVSDPAEINIAGPATMDVTEDGGASQQATKSVIIVDPDIGEATFTLSTPAYGTVTASAGMPSTITYVLKNSVLAVQQLNSGETLTDSFDIVSADGLHKTITVTIHGTDGAPINGNDSDNPALIGTFDRETIDGKAGNDVFSGHLAGDTLIGGDGDDRFNLGAHVPLAIVEGNGAASGTDTITSTISRSLLLYANVENLKLLGTGAIDGIGNALANEFDGRNGGINVFTGLGGDDVYILDAGDMAVEAVNGGNDIVYVDFTATIGANVETLALYGTVAIKAIGNGLGNRLDGTQNSAANELRGLAGDDVYFVGVGDTVTEAAGAGYDVVVARHAYTLDANTEELVLAGTAAITGTGNSLANRLDGTLNSAANLLKGLVGNDTYIVGAGDIVQELAGGGTDIVGTKISYTLSANVENLVLLGANAISGTGNGLGNFMDGSTNSRANVLKGLGGNDTYLVGAGDVAVELAGGGTSDVVRALVTYRLGSNLEHLVLVSAGNQNGTGNTLANSIIGNARTNILDGGIGNDSLDGKAGADILIGGAGADFMTGGTGNDTFRFLKTSDSFGSLIDAISDFDDPGGNDTIDVSALFGPRMTYIHNAQFTKLGQVRINDVAGADVVVEINTTGTLQADFAIRLKATTLASMTASDFIL